MLSYSKEDINAKVSKLLSDLKIDNTFPRPVEKIAEKLGYKTYWFNPTDNTKDISGLINHNEHSIFINKNEPIRRQLFTLAHEIGHITLHEKDENIIDFRNGLSDKKESEANYFAAELLMPKELFVIKWKEFNKNLFEISNFFGTSELSVAIRADSLGI